VCLTSIFVYTQIRLGDRATLPPRILTQRTLIAAAVFSALGIAAFFVEVIYLPLYFQGIKGTSATQSGISILPFLISAVVGSIVVGGLVTWLGVYVPFLIGGTTLFAIGSGLISTFRVDTSFGRRFGYQVLAGAGGGLGFQIPLVAVQTVLPQEDVAVGTACAVLFQSLGGAVFIAVGQTLFERGLVRGLRAHAPRVDPGVVLGGGATRLREALAREGMEEALPAVLEAYMAGLVDVFRMSAACAAAAVVTACCFEWRSVKGEAHGKTVVEDCNAVVERGEKGLAVRKGEALLGEEEAGQRLPPAEEQAHE
jgi:MFS family permease